MKGELHSSKNASLFHVVLKKKKIYLYRVCSLISETPQMLISLYAIPKYLHAFFKYFNSIILYKFTFCGIISDLNISISNWCKKKYYATFSYFLLSLFMQSFHFQSTTNYMSLTPGCFRLTFFLSKYRLSKLFTFRQRVSIEASAISGHTSQRMFLSLSPEGMSSLSLPDRFDALWTLKSRGLRPRRAWAKVAWVERRCVSMELSDDWV